MSQVKEGTRNISLRALDFRHWAISRKLLVVMVALSLIPLIVATTINTTTSASAINEQTRAILSRFAFSTAQRSEQFLVDNHNFLRMAARDPDVIDYLEAAPQTAPALKPGLDRTVNDILASDPALDLVGFYNTSGIVVAHNNAAIVGQDYSFRDYVTSALKGIPFTSDMQVGWTTDTPGINASQPVKDGGKIIGAIATRIQGKFVTDILKSTLAQDSGDALAAGAGADSDIYLVNQYGIVVGQSRNTPMLYRSLGTITSKPALDTIASTRLLGGTCPNDAGQCDPNTKTPRTAQAIPSDQPLADVLLQAFKTGTSGSFRYCQPNNLNQVINTNSCDFGRWHVVGFAPVKDPFQVDPTTKASANLFMVVVDVPESVFLAPVDRERTQSLVIAIAMAAIAVAGSLLLARTLANPIGKLANAARAVGAGKAFDPASIADVTARGDEVGNLARVFSNMVVALRARVAELATIYQIGQTISSSVDLQQTMDYIIQALRPILPFSVAEVCLYDELQNRMILSASSRTSSNGSDPVNTLFDVEHGYLGLLFKRRRGLLVTDTQTFTEAEPVSGRSWEKLGPRSYLGVPLITKNELIGTIELVGDKPGVFDEDNLRILESIAIQAAVAIQNAEQVRQRERELQRQIEELRIEIDESQRKKEVEEITGSDFFQDLTQKAQRIRNRLANKGTEDA